MAALAVATDPLADVLIPQTQPGFVVPVGYVSRKDGTQRVYHFSHFLSQARDNTDVVFDLERVWLSGALLAVGDALAVHSYFDRAPELELLRHLRNGIAHGNRFRIDKPSSLAKFPAHNRLALVKSDLKTDFEVTPALDGTPILFDFMKAGDVLDLVDSVALHLIRM